MKSATLAVILVLTLISIVWTCSGCSTDPDIEAIQLLIPTDAEQGRAVSLKMLEEVLKDNSLEEAQTLCGITRLIGFVVDRRSRDIILIGKVNPSLPSLHTDDFVVALRAASKLYARREGRVRYYAPPGCSIDPDPETIRQLQRITDSDRQDFQELSNEWKAIGSQPQNVRVSGVPFDSRFAKVMVDADYDMKHLSDGSIDLGIEGFASTMAMRIEEVKQRFRSGIESSMPASSMNRFWFSPGETTYKEDDGSVLLIDCEVVLLTEEEFLSHRGEIEGLGRPSILASRFADSFTTHYDTIAKVRPIYRELESLFRFYAITTLLQDTDAASKSGNRMQYLLSGYDVKSVEVSPTLPGLTQTVELTDRQETSHEYMIQQVILMTCGGVDMGITARRIASTPSSPSMRQVVLATRESPSDVYWDFPILR